MQNLAELQAKLEQIKAIYGEELFASAYKDLRQMLGSEDSEVFKNCLEALEAVEATQEAPKEPPKAVPRLEHNEALQSFLTALVCQHIPSLKSQAQFDALGVALQTLCTLAEAICTGNKEVSQQSKKALNDSLTALELATDLTGKLTDVPEAASSSTANIFKEEPKELHEHEVQKDLLVELNQQTDIENLNRWYLANRYRMDRIVSQVLRNELFDNIRKKKEALRGG